MTYKILLTNNKISESYLPVKLLKDSGYCIINTYHTGNHLLQFSNKKTKHYRICNSVKDPDNYFRKILALVIEHQIDLIIPNNIETALILSDFRQELEKRTHLILPDNRYFNILCDNWLMNEYTTKLNIPTPKTFLPNSELDIKKIIEELKFPILIKTRQNLKDHHCTVVKNLKEFQSSYNAMKLNYGTLILQEHIENSNSEVFVQALCIDGRIKNMFCYTKKSHRSFLFKKTNLISIKNQNIENYVQVILENLQWHGIVTLCFKLDKVGDAILTNAYPLMELPSIKTNTVEYNFIDIMVKNAMGEKTPMNVN